MTHDERRIWDERYRSGEYVPRSQAGPFLESCLPQLPRGRALDVACGAGRHAVRLAEAGFEVDAVDVSEVATTMAAEAARAAGVEVNWITDDLDTYEPERSHYALITVIRYRNPGLWPRLITALAPDGWLIVEHHVATTLDVDGPRNPDFRLKPGELLDAFGALRVMFYEETIEERDDDGSESRFALARLVACNGDPGF